MVIAHAEATHAPTDGVHKNGRVMIIDPVTSGRSWMTMDDFMARWDGELILFASRASLAVEAQRFDFTWFIPAVIKYRKLLLEVLLVSVAL